MFFSVLLSSTNVEKTCVINLVQENESLKESQDDDELETCQLNENEILRAKNNSKIYIRRVIKSVGESSQPKKKLDRVYNSRQCCLFCEKMVLHLPVHLKAKHKNEPEIKAIFEKKDKHRFDEIKRRGNDKHNKTVLKEGIGELVLSRRPVTEFVTENYGPCPHCFEWMNIETLKRHQSKCKSEVNATAIATINGPNKTVLSSKKVLQLKSDIISGRISSDPSPKLQNEVFSIMTRDTISTVAKSDRLIVSLGDSWLKRSVGNPKGKYYASQHMRLMARLLINLQSIHHDVQSRRLNDLESESSNIDQKENDISMEKVKSLWEFLVPAHFQDVMKAAVMCAYPYMDDIEDLKSPSNAIKIKHDLVRLLDIKWSFIQSEHHLDGADQCDIFRRMMGIHWNESVTRLARAVLFTRSLSKESPIPSPDDIRTLTKHITSEIKKLDLSEPNQFKRVMMLTQARLLMFNKRRSGEVDNVS